MKNLYALLFCIIFSMPASAQLCTGTIGNNVTVITQDTTITSFGYYWVCSGLTVDLLGSGFAWVEDDCTVTIDGFVGNFTFKSNCTVTVMGSNHIVVYDSTTTVIDNSSNLFPTVCPMVDFDYTNAPAGGCSISTSVEDLSTDLNVHVFPNPANAQLHIGAADQGVSSLRLMDLRGRTVLTRTTNTEQLDVSSVPAGTYLLEITTSKGVALERVAIR